MLFDSLLESLLPPISLPPTGTATWGEGHWAQFYASVPARAHARGTTVLEIDVPNVGTLSEFTKRDGYKVAMLKTATGGHNGIGWQGGVHEVIRHMFDLE